MPLFTKESLETLRSRIDLVEVLSTHIHLQAAGAHYKALCPFHDEKTPSFTVQRGDSHYHCFGCGAHGDAIQFLMNHLKMGFLEAVESLAQRFGVVLQRTEESEEKKGPSKTLLKEVLEHANRLYHFTLLHTEEGHQALQYLYERGLDLDFIRHFQVGLAPKAQGMLRQTMRAQKISDELLAEVGLLSEGREGGWREFFYERITFPIRNGSGAVIGFSARKYKPETFGGKYINTPETPLFKKSQVLFGLNYSRRRIAKERKAIIVEGQIDALRLIQAGFNITVAALGTAFGEGHVKELIQLGVNEVYIAFDADEAGQEAASKVGNLLQKEGVGVFVVKLPKGSDPDSLLNARGPEAFLKLIEEKVDYLTFLVGHLSRKFDVNSPAGKNELVQTIVQKIRSWDEPIMVHESLRQLARLTQVPQEMVGMGQQQMPQLYVKRTGIAGMTTVDPDRVLETDFLRWLLLTGDTHPHFIAVARLNLISDALHVPLCRKIYATFLEAYEKDQPRDLLALASALDDADGQALLTEILNKKINRDRAAPHFKETMQRILDRNWMEQREAVKQKMMKDQLSDDETLALTKEFNELQKNPPKISWTADA